MLITRLLLILEIYNAKPTHTKSWARNLWMLDLTFGPSFKVKRWFTGFGKLSFRWVQICIGSPMCRSSLFLHQFPCRCRIMVSLEYLPYYWKLCNHIWQLYTLGMEKKLYMLKFDVRPLSRSHGQKLFFYDKSADIMASLCGVDVNNFSKTTRPREMLFLPHSP